VRRIALLSLITLPLPVYNPLSGAPAQARAGAHQPASPELLPPSGTCRFSGRCGKGTR